MTDEVTLLDYWASMFRMRCQVALAEKGVEYKYKEEDLWEQERDPPPDEPGPQENTCPRSQDKPICESLIIVEYINESWSQQAPLLLSDPYERARARFWANYVDEKFYDLRKNLWTTKGEEQEEAKKEFIESLKLMEIELRHKPFFEGKKFRFLDISFTGFYSWFYSYEMVGSFSIEAECPKLVAWGKRCMEKESMSKSLPDP